MRKIKTLVIHCSDTYSHMDQVNATMIRRWHVEENGWDDIGYHYVILRNGNVERGRTDDIIGAHAAGHNHDSLGICMVGGKGSNGKPESNFTMAQWKSLAELCTNLKFKYNAGIIGHCDVSSKACPSFNVVAWAKTIGD